MVIRYQAFLSNISNFQAHLYMSHRLNPNITTTPGKSGPGSSGTEGVLHTPQN